MSKVVFLDFDGVLLPDPLAQAQTESGLTFNNYLEKVQFDTSCVDNLLKLVHDVEAEIVLSTSWALGHSLSELGNCLRRNGIDPGLIWSYDDPSSLDWMTPRRLTSNRAQEIQWWMYNHADVSDWCAIDDLSVIGQLAPHAVITDPTLGFDDASLQKALAIMS